MDHLHLSYPSELITDITFCSVSYLHIYLSLDYTDQFDSIRKCEFDLFINFAFLSYFVRLKRGYCQANNQTAVHTAIVDIIKFYDGHDVHVECSTWILMSLHRPSATMP